RWRGCRRAGGRCAASRRPLVVDLDEISDSATGPTAPAVQDAQGAVVAICQGMEAEIWFRPSLHCCDAAGEPFVGDADNRPGAASGGDHCDASAYVWTFQMMRSRTSACLGESC